MRDANRAIRRFLVTAMLTGVALTVACDDEPFGPSFGSISIDLVTTDPAPPPVPPAAAPGSTSVGAADGPQQADGHRASDRPARPDDRETILPDRAGEDAEGVGDGEDPVVGSPTLSVGSMALFDAVSVRVEGPTNKTASLTQEGANWVGTVDGLEPGSYTVTVQGSTGGQVTYYGTTTGVNVARGQNTTASVPWNTFQPSLGAVPARSLQTQLSVSWGPVTGATRYDFQWANNPTFSSPHSTSVTGTTGTAGPVADGGMHYVRVRASNATVSNGAWSDPASFEALTDTTASGDDHTNAPNLGFAPTTGRTGLNILPSSDRDWFAVQACVLDTLIAEVRAQRLSPTSGLNSFLEIRSADGQAVIASNGDAVGTDSRIELVFGESATYNIVVSGTANTVGYYELDIDVAAGPANTGSSCSIVTQVPTTVTVSPAGAALAGVGSTHDFTVEVRDQQDWLINPAWYDVAWAALNPDVATAPGGTLPGTDPATVTAQRDGQVIIEAGVSGVKGYAVLTVTAPGAAQANVFDTLPAPSRALGLGSWGASASDIWVSGMDNTISYKALMHYDGASWTMDPTINGTASSPMGYLWSTWGTSATNVFAVGYHDVLHYDGSWSVMVPANVLAPELFDIWGAAPTDVYVAGDGGVFHWNGAVWDTAYAAPTESFWEVWGTAANDIWAADRSNHIYHYDGSAWTLHTTTSAWITDMWGADADDIWACGDGIMAHWDGGSWSEEPAPIALCLGIWGTSSSDIYASSLDGELAHYDGSGWTLAGRNGISQFYAPPWGTATDEIWLPGWQQIWRGHRGGSVTLTAGASNILRGDTLHLTATVRDGGGNVLPTAPVVYSASNTGIATVTQAGIVTGRGSGTVDIVATALGGAADTIQLSVSSLIVEFKNVRPWSNLDSLTLIAAPFNFTPGVDYLVKNMSALRDSIPRNAGVVILPSAASSTDSAIPIQNSATARANLNSWVSNGGWLVVHAADNFPGGSYLAPGMTAIVDDSSTCFGETLTVSDHALIRGPDGTLGTADDLDNTKIDLTGPCSDNHGALNGKLPAGATILMREGGGSLRPTYATYTYGNGRVIITTLTLEFGNRSPQTLINHFWWALQGSPWGAPAPPATEEHPAPLADPLVERLGLRR